MSTDLFIFMVLTLVNAMMALAMLFAARSLGQPRIAGYLSAAFGMNVVMYSSDAAYNILFEGNIWINLIVNFLATIPPVLATLAYRLRSGLPLFRRRFFAAQIAATLLMTWLSAGLRNQGFADSIVPFFAAGVLLFGITALWRPGRALRLGERPLIVTAIAMATIEIGGGIVMVMMGNTPTPALEQAYTYIIFLGLPGMTMAAGIFSLYLLAGDLAERLRIAADTDPLTGAPNRRAIDATGTRMIAESRSARLPLSVALCDIDHFKDINDIHGHGRGDDVLRRLTALFREQIGPQEYFGRFGGEEFVILFPGLRRDQAGERVEQLRQQIMSLTIADWQGPLTASFGVATLDREDRILADLLTRADRALYLSKERGRNRTTIDGDFSAEAAE